MTNFKIYAPETRRHYYFKYCDDCEKRFQPTARRQIYCKTCKKKPEHNGGYKTKLIGKEKGVTEAVPCNKEGVVSPPHIRNKINLK